MEARRKIVSRRIGTSLSKAIVPMASTMLPAAPADQRDEAGQPATFDVAAHDVVHPRQPRQR